MSKLFKPYLQKLIENKLKLIDIKNISVKVFKESQDGSSFAA